MSEIRDELEQQFASADEQQSKEQKVNDTAEQAQNAVANVDEWLNAPAAYTNERKETFKALPQDWRKYLIEREKQVEKGFSDFGNKVNSYKYIDDLFNGRQERLKQMGFNNAKEWVEFMALADDGLAVSPKATIEELAGLYGVNTEAKQGNETNELMARLNSNERQIQQLNQMFQDSLVKREIANFVNAKDDAGNPKYPYFEDVKQNMGVLMDKGICKTLEEAYNQSIWANEEVRKKLIEAQNKADLTAKTAAAAKAKEAGFTPTSKAEASATETDDLREQLEKAFDELG